MLHWPEILELVQTAAELEALGTLLDNLEDYQREVCLHELHFT